MLHPLFNKVSQNILIHESRIVKELGSKKIGKFGKVKKLDIKPVESYFR